MMARVGKEVDETVLQTDDVVFKRRSEPGKTLLAALIRVLHQCRHRVNGPRDGCNA